MSTFNDKIPFAVEIGRMIELLAAQIYPSPFALLRENVQNSFDAVLLRRHLHDEFVPRIDVAIEPTSVRVRDNGIGMSREELRTHFWRAGSSSKNTPEASAAGVVGTFGIGAMANFGIAEELTVTTESAKTRERTRCSAARSTLSVTEDCISFEAQEATGEPGTEIIAAMQDGKAIDVGQAIAYIKEFVAFVALDVFVNGELVSRQPVEAAVPRLVETWSLRQPGAVLGGELIADIELSGAVTGDVRIDMSSMSLGGHKLDGRMILRQGVGNLRTLRSQFGLATTSVSSLYQFGGVADFLFLQPTAGREAITTEGTQLLQRLVAIVDEFVSLQIGQHQESNSSAPFVNWAARHRRYDLCGHLRVRIHPGESVPLADVRTRSQQAKMLVYSGTDPTLIGHATEDRPIIVLSRASLRRECELGYLRSYCAIDEMTDEPTIVSEKSVAEYSIAESALAFRVSSILSSDYFLDAEVRFGKISHSLPILLQGKQPPKIYLDPSGSSAALLLDVYDREFASFGHMAKDFVRNIIFPRVADLVPSATRQGAAAFLKSIQRTREVFEWDTTDLENLTALWKDYLDGKIPMPEAARRAAASANRSYQVLDSGAAATVRDVVPDVVDNEALLPRGESTRLEATPPIQRLDIATDRKLLTIPEGDPALKGFRAFLAITDRVREERGDFFLQPHRTSVVWGGQRALFIFEHQSGQIGLYYDIQTVEPIAAESGGGAFETCTIVMKNRIFIPVPPAIQVGFLPKAGERKRVEVKYDILYMERR